MDKIIEHKIDREGWSPGPWDSEPDRIEWRSEGTPCLIVRNMFGALCGYAAVAPGHPFYKKDYGRCAKWFRRKNLPQCWKGWCKHRPESFLEAHGGLTFSGSCHGAICHVAQPGEPDPVWWFGFDCAHAWDRSPGMDATLRKIKALSTMGHKQDVYRDVAYVKAEVEQLAAQLRGMRNVVG